MYSCDMRSDIALCIRSINLAVGSLANQSIGTQQKETTKMSSMLSTLLLALMCLTITQAQDDGYEEFPIYTASRYKMPPFRLNWTDALAACQSDGGNANLVVINSDVEAQVVDELIDRMEQSDNVYVGINDIEVEGTWRTVHGGLVSASGYDKWINNQPNGGVLGNCGFVLLNPLYGDIACESVRPFICEKPNV